MVPLIGEVDELKVLKENVIEPTAEKVFSDGGTEIDFKVGTMIEIPRAALTADEIAKEAEFFSFGTNDLTQMTFGFSRDDVGSFVPSYLEQGILSEDPFQVLDEKGVGLLIKIATDKGKQFDPNMSIGICGEHGGEPKSIKFASKVGLDYVSCSPYRVPVARVAAAQAEIANPS